MGFVMVDNIVYKRCYILPGNNIKYSLESMGMSNVITHVPNLVKSTRTLYELKYNNMSGTPEECRKITFKKVLWQEFDGQPRTVTEILFEKKSLTQEVQRVPAEGKKIILPLQSPLKFLQAVGGPFGTVPELLFEKKRLIPSIHQLLAPHI